MQVERKKRDKVLRPIDVWMIDYIKPYNLVVLREVSTGKALDVSYTEAGLKWATDKVGKYIYFQKGKKFQSDTYATVIGEKKSPYVVVEHFVPRNHYNDSEKGLINIGKQIAELYVIDKAMRLLTPMNVPSNESPTLNKF